MDNPMILNVIILMALLFINGFFSSAEVAFGALTQGKISHDVEDDTDGTNDLLFTLLCAPQRTVATIQVLITFSIFLSAAYAVHYFGDALADLILSMGFDVLSTQTLNTVATLLILLFLTFLHLVLGELVPKRVAMKRPEEVARVVAAPIYAFFVLLRPITWLLNRTANLCLRLVGIDPTTIQSALSEEEIRNIVDRGEEKGSIEPEKKEMIQNIFEFNNLTAEDVMIHRTDMVMLWAEDTSQEIVNTIQESGLSRFPVYDEDSDDIIGILTTRTWLLNERLLQPKPLRELLRTPYFVPESVATDVLLRDLQSKKTHLAIVVDEYGGTSGLVTMEDLLEEIVGNIYDEFDPQDQQEIIPLGENLWRVAGSTDLEELAERLELPSPEEEYDTLGGLIFDQLSVIPEDGQHPEVEAWGLHIKVETLCDRRVEWAIVSKSTPVAAPTP